MKEQETRFSTKSCCQKSGFCFDTQLQHHSFSCLFVATRNGVPQSECCAGPPHDENLEPLLQAVADPARTRRPRDTPAACRGNSARSLSVCLSPSLFLSLPHPLPLSLPLSSLSPLPLSRSHTHTCARARSCGCSPSQASWCRTTPQLPILPRLQGRVRAFRH